MMSAAKNGASVAPKKDHEHKADAQQDHQDHNLWVGKSAIKPVFDQLHGISIRVIESVR